MPPPYCYDHPRPSVTVDVAAFAIEGADLRVLLVRRGRDPFQGSWALPGGFLDIDEPPEAGARRELREETGLDLEAPIHPLGFYARPDRDPRGRTISLAYAAAVPASRSEVRGGDDAAEAAWRSARDEHDLAFDHASILGDALTWLAAGVRRGDLAPSLLPEIFDEAEVRRIWVAISGSPRGASHWLKKAERLGMIEPRAGSGRLFQVVKE